MKFRRLLLVFLLSCLYSNAHSQNNTVASGAQATGSGGTVDYSVGQVAYISMEDAGGNINQGVQQPYEFFVIIGTNSISEVELIGAVYPVPTKSDVNLHLERDDISNLSYALFSATGQLLTEENIISKNTPIPMEYLPVGIYFLRVKNDSTELKEFKIVKN